MKFEPLYPLDNIVNNEIPRRKDYSLLFILFGVLLLHFLIIAICYYVPLTSLNLKETSPRFIVKTVPLHPAQPFTALTSAKERAEATKSTESSIPLEIPPLPEIALEDMKEQKKEPLQTENKSPPPPPLPNPTKEETKEPETKKTIPEKEEQKAPAPPPKETIPVSKPINKPNSNKPKKSPVNKPQAPVEKSKNKPKDPKVDEKKLNQQKEQEKLRELEKKKQAEEEAEKQKQAKLLAKAQEKLAAVVSSRSNLEKSKVPSIGDTNIASQLNNLQVDSLEVGQTYSELSIKEKNYRDEVQQIVCSTLSLPEHGSFEIKLTLDRSGKVLNLQIIKCECIKNRQYIERFAPTLVFPKFGNRFGDAPQYTFLIHHRD